MQLLWWGKQLIRLMTRQDARYVLLCRGCGTVRTYQRDSKTVQNAREGNETCDCGSVIELAKDAKR